MINAKSIDCTHGQQASEKLTRQELFGGDPRHIRNHSKAIMIEQLMYAGGGGQQRRNELEAMTEDEVRKEWNFQLGYLME